MPHPRIGFFWFLPSVQGPELVAVSEAEERVPHIGGFRTLDLGHVEHWREVRRARPELAGVEYEDCPRGRVNWREADGRYLLLLDPVLRRPDRLAAIVDAFCLPRDRTRVMTDPHYRSTLPRRPLHDPVLPLGSRPRRRPAPAPRDRASGHGL